MTYNPGQVNFLLPYLKEFSPQWLILGGPADGDEAQCLVTRYPHLQVLAVEPCSFFHEWQWANGFPRTGKLLAGALGALPRRETLQWNPSHPRSASCRRLPEEELEILTEAVSVFTLDSLNEQYGPFQDALLWLDIEGMELEALHGAPKLLASRRVQLINVEMLLESPQKNTAIDTLIRSYGYFYRDHWDRQSGNHYDTIYTLTSPTKHVVNPNLSSSE